MKGHVKQFASLIGTGITVAVAAKAGQWLWDTVLEEKAYNLVTRIKQRKKTDKKPKYYQM